jgi:threonine dehydrogenase-like Zn-dependent dehydrogenase
MKEETFDLVIDCTGSPAALEQAIGKTKFGATILVFGCAPMGKAMKYILMKYMQSSYMY